LEDLKDRNRTLDHLLRNDPAEPGQGLIRSDMKLRAQGMRPMPRYLRNHPANWKALCDLDARAEY
jgi:hypothetical protein